LKLDAPSNKGSVTQKALFILGAIVAVSVTFYAGRASYSGSNSFQHVEVFDLVDSCPESQFIGGCVSCTDCTDWQYPAGGCSYFKDTFCTLCEPIYNCPQEQIRCTSKDDQVCLSCDPGFWDVDCKPCSVCPLQQGYFEAQACTQTSDTVCQKATQCEDKQFMSKQLEYFSDRECTDCTVCEIGTFTSVECQMGDNDANLVGADTVCQKCTECEIDQHVTRPCTIMQDTECTDCATCPESQYITELCVQGGIFVPGVDTECTDCTVRKESEWELFSCGGTSDALFRECSTCLDGEYQLLECTETSDTLCPDCTPIPHCPKDGVTCTSDEDSVCSSGCEEGFSGDTCCYQKTFGDCGTITTRERIAFRYGFEGETNEEFIKFCETMCEEFPDCFAFEVEDGGTTLEASGENNLVSKTAACFFKAAYTVAPTDPSKDCYSNICRQEMRYTGLQFY